MELLITVVLFVLLVVGLWWLSERVPHPMLKLVFQVCIGIGGFVWLYRHVPAIIHAIAGA